MNIFYTHFYLLFYNSTFFRLTFNVNIIFITGTFQIGQSQIGSGEHSRLHIGGVDPCIETGTTSESSQVKTSVSTWVKLSTGAHTTQNGQAPRYVEKCFLFIVSLIYLLCSLYTRFDNYRKKIIFFFSYSFSLLFINNLSFSCKP